MNVWFQKDHCTLKAETLNIQKWVSTLKQMHSHLFHKSFTPPVFRFIHTYCLFSLLVICLIPPASPHISSSVPNLDAFSPFLFPLSSNILIKFFFFHALLHLIYNSFFFPLSFFFVPPPSPHAADNWPVMRWWKQSTSWRRQSSSGSTN